VIWALFVLVMGLGREARDGLGATKGRRLTIAITGR
jgi:hypothetical protein